MPPLFKADNATLSFYATNQRDLSGLGSIEGRARGATFVVTWSQGQVEARIVDRMRPQSSHWSTKTVRCTVIGWGHLFVLPQLRCVSVTKSLLWHRTLRWATKMGGQYSKYSRRVGALIIEG